MLIKRVYEVDPLSCPQGGGQMPVVAFIEPPQRDVIEKILRGHQSGAMVGGLWRSSAARATSSAGGRRLEMAPVAASKSKTSTREATESMNYIC